MKTKIKSENRDGQPRMTRMARMKSNFSTEDPEPLRAKNTAQPSRNQTDLTAEDAEYAEGKRASVWFSAYFAVQSSSGHKIVASCQGAPIHPRRT